MAGLPGRPKLIERVFEARYSDGYRYLDRCGEVMLLLESTLSKQTDRVWMPDQMQPNGAILKCPELDLKVAMDSAKMFVDYAPPDESFDFKQVCDIVLRNVVLHFGIRAITRLGSRCVYILGKDSVEEAEAASTKAINVSQWPQPSQRDLSLNSCDLSTAYEDPQHKHGVRLHVLAGRKVEAPEKVDERLSLPPHLLPDGQREALRAQMQNRRKRESDPDAGLVIDMDYYWIKPKEPQLDEFMKEADAECSHLLGDFLKERHL
jgi:hypothetical protein